MQSATFKTISKVSEGFYKEKGSKFYAFAFPVVSEVEIKTHITQLRKTHHQAVHVCSAFRLGSDKKVFRASDDGEPSNSAGPPILGQIKAFDLTNILIAVVRYYGGVNLGVGGLINAYRIASKNAIESNQIIEKEDIMIYELVFEYSQMSFVMQQLKNCNSKILKQETDINCRIRFSLPVSETAVFKNVEEFNTIHSENLPIQIISHGISQ